MSIDPDEVLKKNKNAIWWSANHVVKLLEDFQPDLVIVVLGSGVWPWMGAAHLWDIDHSGPLPPVLEMHVHWDEMSDVPVMLYLNTQAGGDSPELRGQIMAWAQDQPKLVDHFAPAITNRLNGIVPERLLFVDDVHSSGATAAMALAMAHRAFPGVQAEFATGYLRYWRSDLAMAWLVEHRPKRGADWYTEVAHSVSNSLRLYERGESGTTRKRRLDVRRSFSNNRFPLDEYVIEEIVASFAPTVLGAIDEALEQNAPTNATGVQGTDRPLAVRFDATTRLWHHLGGQGAVTLGEVVAITSWEYERASKAIDQYIDQEMLAQVGDRYSILPEYLLGHFIHGPLYESMGSMIDSRVQG